MCSRKRLTDSQLEGETDRYTNRQTDDVEREIDSQTERRDRQTKQIYRQTDRQTVEVREMTVRRIEETDGQTDVKTDRQIGIAIDSQIDRER